MPDRERQGKRLQPIFQRLQSVFDDNRDPLTLRDDPTAIAPERVLVFEVAGPINHFAQAAKKAGLEYLGEEEKLFDPDEDFAYYDKRKGHEGELRYDKPIDGRLYLSMPDVQALQQLLSLWKSYQKEQRPKRGFSPWVEVFKQLRNLRSWGPSDRIPEDTITYIQTILENKPDSTIRLEVELWSFRDVVKQKRAISDFEQAIRKLGGEIIDQASISEIAYEAALIDLSAKQASILSQQKEGYLTICDYIMWIRPQTIASFPTEIEPLDEDKVATPVVLKYDQPIVALLDGVPIQNHICLNGRIRLDDPDGLEGKSTVAKRRHGTEMASLILNGDLSLNEPPLQRPIYMRPVIYATGDQQEETPQKDNLLIDTIYQAITLMKKGGNGGRPTAPDVFIVNLSLGDRNQPFAGIISPWARLLDYLAEKYGILFIVSTGNIDDNLEILNLYSNKELESKTPEELAKTILYALKGQRLRRTLLSPAEAVNIVTIGSWHQDDQSSHIPSYTTYAPYNKGGPNISSALGLGYLKTIKPDIYMPGGRERFRVMSSSKKGLGIR